MSSQGRGAFGKQVQRLAGRYVRDQRTHEMNLARVAANANKKGSVSPMAGSGGAQLPEGGSAPSPGGPLPSPGMGPGSMKSSSGVPSFDAPPRRKRKRRIGGY